MKRSPWKRETAPEKADTEETAADTDNNSFKISIGGRFTPPVRHKRSVVVAIPISVLSERKVKSLSQ